MARPDFTDKHFKVGDRVQVAIVAKDGSGKEYGGRPGSEGTIVAGPVRHNGFKVRWDHPRFGCTESWVRIVNLVREGTGA